MARLLAVLRLLLRLSKKELQSVSSVGLNNLFLCVAVLASASHNPRAAFWVAFPFLFLLSVPLLFAVSADAMKRLPPERWRLWPLDRTQVSLVRVLAVAISPVFWLGAAVLLLWAGIAACLAFFLLAITIQVCVALAVPSLRRYSGLHLLRYVPRLPGSLGGVVQLGIRQLATTLDFAAALVLCLAGTLYRYFATMPNADAFPIVALLIALTLGTYAQRTFGLDARGGLTRYRLLPVAGWRILLAKDAAFLGVTAGLVLPFNLRVGITCCLVSVAVGRWPSLRQNVAQRRWRFTGGDLRFGIVQVLGGAILGIAAYRVSLWFLAAAAFFYAASLFAADRWWRTSVQVAG